MAFEIHDTTHVYKVWYVELAPSPNGESGNLMIMIYRNPPEGWCATYRFRWYKDAHIFNSNDRRSWYDIKPPPGDHASLAKLVNTFERMLTMAPWPNTPQCVHVDAVGETAMNILKKQPWMHSRAMD